MRSLFTLARALRTALLNAVKGAVQLVAAGGAVVSNNPIPTSGSVTTFKCEELPGSPRDAMRRSPVTAHVHLYPPLSQCDVARIHAAQMLRLHQPRLRIPRQMCSKTLLPACSQRATFV